MVVKFYMPGEEGASLEQLAYGMVEKIGVFQKYVITIVTLAAAILFGSRFTTVLS